MFSVNQPIATKCTPQWPPLDPQTVPAGPGHDWDGPQCSFWAARPRSTSAGRTVGASHASRDKVKMKWITNSL